MIAADGGARHAGPLGLRIDRWVGDGDLLGEAGLAALAAQGVPIERAPFDKDASDTELAVVAALARGPSSLTILGALGGPRLDHALANLATPASRGSRVPLFKDATGRPGLDQKVTDKVIEELLKRGRFEVVQEPVGADALVEGELLRYEPAPVGFSGGGTSEERTQASRYNITLVARVKYAKTGAAEPIWQNERFTFTDEYDLGSDPTAFFDRETQALDRLASSFARSLVAAMLEAF